VFDVFQPRCILLGDFSMAKTPVTSPETTPTPSPEQQAFIDALKAITEQNALAAGPRKVKIGQQSEVTPFNPTGKKNRKLKRLMFNHGEPLDVRRLSD